MTRKRYVKLAMSRGIGRNQANEIADTVSVVGTYKELNKATAVYAYAKRIVDGIQSAGKALCKFVENLSNALVNAMDAIKELFSGIFNVMHKIHPRQRYRIAKKLGPDTYPVFFHRKPIYHCRNNC